MHFSILTNIGIFCLALANKIGHPSVKILAEFASSVDVAQTQSYYSIYYLNLGLFQGGGNIWNDWNKQFRTFIVKQQNKDGSFMMMPDAVKWEEKLNLNYTTAMAVLSLEVYYRYLPIYQLVKKDK